MPPSLNTALWAGWQNSTIQAFVLIGLTSTQATVKEDSATVQTELDTEDTIYDDDPSYDSYDSYDSQNTPPTAQASTTEQAPVTQKDTTIFYGDLTTEKTGYAQTFSMSNQVQSCQKGIIWQCCTSNLVSSCQHFHISSRISDLIPCPNSSVTSVVISNLHKTTFGQN